jgi:hypothetical protein
MQFNIGSQHALRRYLLTTASGAALIGSAPLAYGDTPIDHVYLDFGGQYTMWGGGHTIWDDFGDRIGAKNGWDANGDVALQSGNWYLTLSANYGRTGVSHRSYVYFGAAKHEESHTIVDFTIGKDVGLGMLGLDGSSIISGGVRYEHFIGHTVAHFNYAYPKYEDDQFSGWGPVITWKTKTPIFPDWYFSWDINGAAVFGSRSFELNFDQIFHKNVFVPQVGATLGVTWQMPDEPLSFEVGFRGNAYFGVFDRNTGEDRTVNRYSGGPFVQVGWQLE